VTLSPVIQTTLPSTRQLRGALVDLTGHVIGVPTLAALDPNSAAPRRPASASPSRSNTVEQIAGPPSQRIDALAGRQSCTARRGSSDWVVTYVHRRRRLGGWTYREGGAGRRSFGGILSRTVTPQGEANVTNQHEPSRRAYLSPWRDARRIVLGRRSSQGSQKTHSLRSGPDVTLNRSSQSPLGTSTSEPSAFPWIPMAPPDGEALSGDAAG
jgi:hypothetical protein